MTADGKAKTAGLKYPALRLNLRRAGAGSEAGGWSLEVPPLRAKQKRLDSLKMTTMAVVRHHIAGSGSKRGAFTDKSAQASRSV